MFYDILKPLCRQRGISTYKMASDLGISSRTHGNWKKGAEPREETKIKIAEYLGVDPSYFDEDDPTITATDAEIEVVKKFADEMKQTDQNEQMLLQAYRTLSDADRNDLLLYALKLKFKS